MAADLATLKSTIASELDRTDLTTQIASAISLSIRYYRSHRFETNEQQASFSTIAQQESYSTSVIPTDIGAIDSLRITVGGRKVVLRPMDFEQMQALSTTTTGFSVPTNWAWYASKVFLYPIPDAIYSVLVSYMQRKAEPANDTDATTIWTNGCEPLIRACAKKLICRDYTYDDAGFQRNLIAEKEALNILEKESILLHDEGGLGSNW